MKTSTIILGVAASAGLLALMATHLPRRGNSSAPEMCTVSRGPMIVRTVYQGTLEPRDSAPIASHLGNAATVIELAPEGAMVAPGDLLVRFDPSTLERDVIVLERDARLAQAKLAELREVTHPLQRDDLELKGTETASLLAQEQRALEDTRALRAEDLVSAQEVTQEEHKVAQLARQADAIQRQATLTRDVQQPSELARAEAEQQASEQELAMLRKQLADARVTAVTAGMVLYTPTHVGGEFRTVRVGDSVYRNQPFLVVANMSNLVVRCSVPEGELARIRAGLPAEVVPLAFSDMRLAATVESIGSTACSVPGRPSWQKFFAVTLRLEQANAQLRSGMTVRISVRSYERADAVLIPRRAVRWEGDRPHCRVRDGSAERDVVLALGPADDAQIEVLSGVEPGQQVLVP